MSNPFHYLNIYCLYLHRGPVAIRLPQYRHGAPAEGGGADTDGHHAVRCQWHPRPGDLLVQRLPARGPQQQPRSHQAAPIRWERCWRSVWWFSLPIIQQIVHPKQCFKMFSFLFELTFGRKDNSKKMTNIKTYGSVQLRNTIKSHTRLLQVIWKSLLNYEVNPLWKRYLI